MGNVQIGTALTVEQKIKELDLGDEESVSEIANPCWAWGREGTNPWAEMVDGLSPPDDFRTLGVIPTVAELLDPQEPFLRRNIVDGQYWNTDHYLDIHFRLLKEDFMRPFRDGLTHFLSGSQKWNPDAKVYRNASFRGTKIEHNGLIFNFQLKPSRQFDLVDSKSLMFGNLVCLSYDNFKSIIIASVGNCDDLRKHRIGLKIEFGFLDKELVKNAPATLIESKAFFVTYCHALNALQAISKLPFQNILLKLEDSGKFPKYLKPNLNDTYELRVKNSLKTVRVLGDLTTWPSCSALDLDESQRKALHNALTQEVSIIQGPPGTGKTHVGLQIARALLNNKAAWKGKSSAVKAPWIRSKNVDHTRKCPILVVCYTNHALDQFLEGISHFTDKIIRVGSRCSKEALRQFQIKLVIAKLKRNNRNIFASFAEVVKELSALKVEMSRLERQLISLEKHGILKLSSFTSNNIIPPTFRCQLETDSLVNYLTGDRDPFSELLNAEDDFVDQIEYERTLPGKYGPLSNPIDFEIDIKDCFRKISFYEEKIEKHPYHRNSRMYYEQALYYRMLVTYIRDGMGRKGSLNDCRALEQARNIHMLTNAERWKLYNYWKHRVAVSIKQEQKRLEQRTVQIAKEFERLTTTNHLTAMQEADVVGMTTTAAGKYYNVLQQLAAPIVIVEEAAEVLEAHVVTSLSENCQHLIMIGDHQQLRPNPTVYQLATEYNLNISLFERLIRNGIRHVCLEYQHRMKPCISRLLVPTIYNTLKDHRCVFTYPKILGLQEDIFFLDHTNQEYGVSEENSSPSNLFEARFSVALCCHLLLQGYKDSDITILTPYAGQHRLIKELQDINSIISGVRIEILDGYQGEECNIIILSLVRSNSSGKAGFMKIDNRICVAISRAKHGFYMLGNMTLLANSSGIWSDIKKKLMEGGSIGTKMKLKCENHPEEVIIVKDAMDFEAKSPEGGCSRNCSASLPKCDHFCTQKCHILDKDHLSFQCKFPCSKSICKLNHLCPKLCFQKCPQCRILVEKILPCGHGTCTIPCSVPASAFPCSTVIEVELPACKHKYQKKCFEECPQCRILVEKILPCGHGTCTIPCSVPASAFPCSTVIEVELPACKHKYQKKCFEDINAVKCKVKCYSKLNCGHNCRLNCHVTQDPNHEASDCHVLCDKTLPCGHTHKVECCVPEIDFPCPTEVDVILPKCNHETKKKCVEDINLINCQINCDIQLDCGHKCVKKCHVDDDPTHSNYNCSVMCDKVLPCGHGHQMMPCSSPESTFLCLLEVIVNLPSCNHRAVKKCCDNIPLDLLECQEKCATQLVCGHECKMKCHATNDPTHRDYDCREKCNRLPEFCEFQHSCPKLCFQNCGECSKIISRNLKCGHTVAQVPCKFPPDKILCRYKCQMVLACGHHCPKLCYQPCGGCMVPVKKTISECLHIIEVECGIDVTSASCSAPCNKTLPCGHSCRKKCNEVCSVRCQDVVYSQMTCPRNHTQITELPCFKSSICYSSNLFLDEPFEWLRCEGKCDEKCRGRCGECYNGRIHVQSLRKCDATLVCGHKCAAPYGMPCPPCQSTCELICSHRTYKWKCGTTLDPCEGKCERRCSHVKCTKRCGETCDVGPCKEPCPKLLPCNHACIGYCAEPCPPICRICNKDNVLFDNELDGARYIMLMDCKHVFEAVGLAADFNGNLSAGFVLCRKCKKPIVNTKRFQSKICVALEHVIQTTKEYYSFIYKNSNKWIFIKKLKALAHRWNSEVTEILRNLGYGADFQPVGKRQLSDLETTLYAFQIDFLMEVSNLKLEVSEQLSLLVKNLMSLSGGITDQTRFQYVSELRRISVMKSVMELRQENKKSGLSNTESLMVDIRTLMDPTSPFSEEGEAKVREKLEEVGIILTDFKLERKPIAIGMGRSYWLTCPNGHNWLRSVEGKRQCPKCKWTLEGVAEM